MQTQTTKRQKTKGVQLEQAATIGDGIKVTLSAFTYNDVNYCRVDFFNTATYRQLGKGIIITIAKWNALIENSDAIVAFLESQGID